MTTVVRAVARLLLAPGLVVAAAIVVKGYSDVGDGFSAGVIVALLVSLQYIALGPRGAEAALPLLRFAPRVAVTGLLLALAVGFFPLAYGGPLFTHLPRPGKQPIKVGTLELTTAVVFDIGVFLLVVGVLVVLVHQLARSDQALAE
ncbi:MAG: MnhB domain-containing protein [Candidatus Rokuibacteriota bacterium]